MTQAKGQLSCSGGFRGAAVSLSVLGFSRGCCRQAWWCCRMRLMNLALDGINEGGWALVRCVHSTSEKYDYTEAQTIKTFFKGFLISLSLQHKYFFRLWFSVFALKAAIALVILQRTWSLTWMFLLMKREVLLTVYSLAHSGQCQPTSDLYYKEITAVALNRCMGM